METKRKRKNKRFFNDSHFGGSGLIFQKSGHNLEEIFTSNRSRTDSHAIHQTLPNLPTNRYRPWARSHPFDMNRIRTIVPFPRVSGLYRHSRLTEKNENYLNLQKLLDTGLDKLLHRFYNFLTIGLLFFRLVQIERSSFEWNWAHLLQIALHLARLVQLDGSGRITAQRLQLRFNHGHWGRLWEFNQTWVPNSWDPSTERSTVWTSDAFPFLFRSFFLRQEWKRNHWSIIKSNCVVVW